MRAAKRESTWSNAVKREAPRETIAASWGLKEIVDQMKEHLGAAGVQQAGCVALHKLFTSADSFIVQVEAVLADAAETEVRQAGCKTLLHLCAKPAANQV